MTTVSTHTTPTPTGNGSRLPDVRPNAGTLPGKKGTAMKGSLLRTVVVVTNFWRRDEQDANIPKPDVMFRVTTLTKASGRFLLHVPSERTTFDVDFNAGTVTSDGTCIVNVFKRGNDYDNADTYVGTNPGMYYDADLVVYVCS